MSIAAAAPAGGISAEIGGRARALVLRNAEIERFEVQHGVGIFAMLDSALGHGAPLQARHVRDLVALGLVGAGMGDLGADQLVGALPPHENGTLALTAKRLVIAAFTPPADEAAAKKKRPAGSRRRSGRATADGTSAPASRASRAPA